MEYKIFNYEEKRGVAVIALKKRVENWEDLSPLNAELSECCQNFRENPETRVLVITGERKDVFSIEDANINIGREGGPSYSLAGPVAAIEKPVIAGIPGDAIGLGLELTLACDLRLATKSARFALPHVKLGAMPWDGGVQRLLRTIGKGKTLEMILTGEPVEGPEALRIGLISRLVNDDRLRENVMELAYGMASKAPISLEYCKEAVNKGTELILEQGLRLEADLYYLIHTTADRSEGIRAFQEKRKLEFKGM